MLQSVFLSYGGPDEMFASKLRNALSAIGARTWLFRDDAIPGQKLHRVMRKGVNDHDRVVLICSEKSLMRSGVRNEIEQVLVREAREGGSSRLLPVTIDEYIFSPKTEFARKHPVLRDEILIRVVADFKGAVGDEATFQTAVSRLALALGKPPEEGYDALDGARTPADPSKAPQLIEEAKQKGLVQHFHYYGDQVAQKTVNNTTTITGGQLAGVAIGEGANAHVEGSITQTMGTTAADAAVEGEQFKQDVVDVLKHFADQLDVLGAKFGALSADFAKLQGQASTVDSKTPDEAAALLKEYIDKEWAEDAVDGLRIVSVDNAAGAAKALLSSPVMVALIKLLFGAPPAS